MELLYDSNAGQLGFVPDGNWFKWTNCKWLKWMSPGASPLLVWLLSTGFDPERPQILSALAAIEILSQ